MKKKCNLFLLLLFLLVGVEAAKANVETFDFTKMGFSADQQINEVKGKGITISFGSKDGSLPEWNKSNQSIKLHGKNATPQFFKITPHNGNAILWKVVITFNSKNKEHYITQKGQYADCGSDPKPDDYIANVTTWKGNSSTNSVTFTNSSHYYWLIQKIEVDYAIGKGTATDPYTAGDINTFFYIENPPTEARYIKGVVSKVEDPSEGTISYHLSDDGIDKAALVVNGGKYLNGADITDKHQIVRGDTLTVYGTVSKDGNQLVLQSPTLASMNACKDQITIKAACWATYVSHRPIDFSRTDGVRAFQTRYEAASNTIVLSPITAIPENTAVVLKGAEGSYTLTNTESVDSLHDNELAFFTVDTPVTEDRTVYVLACKQGVCGFFPLAKGESMPSYKGYLLIKNAATPKPFYSVGTTPTAIRPVEQLQHPTVRYNLAGERVDNNYKGVVIENGKKSFVK